MLFQVIHPTLVASMGQVVKRWLLLMLANGGTYYAPQYVNKIVFSDGTVTEYAPVLKSCLETAYMMTDMMKAVMSYGYGLNASVSGVPMAGKTGTSNYTDSETDTILASIPEANYSYMVVPDENFVGYSSQYAMAVWTGYTNRMTLSLITACELQQMSTTI